MKLKDIFKKYDGYVVALVRTRDSNGYPIDMEYMSCSMSYEEAIREREKLAGMDVMICPPFRCVDNISPAETADYFRSFLGTNSG